MSPLVSPPLNDRESNSSPEQDLDAEVSGLFMTTGNITPPLGRSIVGGGRGSRPQELDLPSHSPSPFMDTMRKVSLSPLREDLDEEELLRETPTYEIEHNSSLLSVGDGQDEGIFMRKLSEASIQSQESNSGLDLATAGKVAQRKVSDASNHSGESGIESSASKMSEFSKENNVDRDSGISCSVPDTDALRKCSASSSEGVQVEEELKELRRKRAGSVKGTIEKFNTLDRHRKTGLSTTAYVNGSDLQAQLKINSSPTRLNTPPPPGGRPHRKSLDSIGSSGSND